MSEIGGHMAMNDDDVDMTPTCYKHDSRAAYLAFEKHITNGVDALWRPDKPNEEVRQLTLKIRIACRDYWLAAGYELPSRIEWEEPSE